MRILSCDEMQQDLERRMYFARAHGLKSEKIVYAGVVTSFLCRRCIFLHDAHASATLRDWALAEATRASARS